MSIIYFGNPISISRVAENPRTYIFDNDAVVLWLQNNGFKKQYNDGLHAYFHTLFLTGGHTFNDLLKQYTDLYGKYIPPEA